MENKVICNCCKNLFDLSEVKAVSSHQVISNSEPKFICYKCLSEILFDENEDRLVEQIKEKVKALNAKDELGYSYIKNKTEDYELIYSYINHEGLCKHKRLYASENLDYIIHLICKITD